MTCNPCTESQTTWTLRDRKHAYLLPENNLSPNYVPTLCLLSIAQLLSMACICLWPRYMHTAYVPIACCPAIVYAIDICLWPN